MLTQPKVTSTMQATVLNLLGELPLTHPSTLIYDLEIKQAVPSPRERRIPDVQYCGGWDDKKGMGISVLCAFSTITGEMDIFMDDNWEDFVNLARQHDIIAGHNHIDFDNPVVLANWGVNLFEGWRQYDTKKELAAASGGQVKGLTLDGICQRNFGVGKTESGAMAPVYWQRGQLGRVINYCAKDVYRTALICLSAWTGKTLYHPASGAPIQALIPR